MYAKQRLGMRFCVRFSYPSLCLPVFSNFLIGHVCVLFIKSLNLFSKIGSTFICILFYYSDNELFHTNFVNALDLNTSMF